MTPGAPSTFFSTTGKLLLLLAALLLLVLLGQAVGFLLALKVKDWMDPSFGVHFSNPPSTLSATHFSPTSVPSGSLKVGARPVDSSGCALLSSFGSPAPQKTGAPN